MRVKVTLLAQLIALVVLGASFCGLPSYAGSPATEDNFGNDLPDSGALTPGKFRRAQKKQKQDVKAVDQANAKNPNNNDSTTTGPQARNQWTQFNSYNNDG